MSNFLEKIKYGISEVARSRTSVAIIVFSVMAAILVQRLFYLQIVRGEDYAEDYELQIQKSKEIEGTRGNIYDRNGNLLAYNELAYSVTFEYSGDYKNKELNQIVSTVIQMVEKNGDSVINDFGIVLDNNDNYTYIAESDTERLRFLADVFGYRTIDKLTEEQRNISAEGLIDYLCTDETYGYGINQKKNVQSRSLKAGQHPLCHFSEQLPAVAVDYSGRRRQRRDGSRHYGACGYASWREYRRNIHATVYGQLLFCQHDRLHRTDLTGRI